MPLNIDFLQVLLHMLNFVILAGGLSLLLYKPIVTALRKANLLAPSSSDAAPVQKKQHLGTILVSLLILITCILGFLVWQGVL